MTKIIIYSPTSTPLYHKCYEDKGKVVEWYFLNLEDLNYGVTGVYHILIFYVLVKDKNLIG